MRRMKMAKETSAGKARKPAAKKAGKARAEKDESQCDYADCPVARAFGLFEEAGLNLKGLNMSDFLAHMATARKEFLLGMKSILEEAIRLEDEGIERRKAASMKKKQSNKERLRRVSIE
jgi:hypothetical protein